MQNRKAQNNTAIKNEPERTCIGCRQKRPWTNLLRIVRTKEGKVFVDAEHKTMGRGAYMCRKKACFEKARKSRAFSRALKDPQVEWNLDSLEKEIELYYEGT